MTSLAQGEGDPPPPSARSVRHALRVLERLPIEAMADLAERLVDRLDVLAGDPDFEPEEDACQAEDVAGLKEGTASDIGDVDDAEPSGDDEPDDDDRCSADEPRFGMHAYSVSRDHLADVHRHLIGAIGRKRARSGGRWEAWS